jgi:drug/metabolite transporter (DMT)-like permease
VLWPRFTLLGGGAMQDAALSGAMLALGSAVCSAFAAIFIRGMTQTESTGAIVLYFALSSSVLSLLSLPFGWVMPSGWEALVLVVMGLLGGVGQILMTQAYKYAGAGTIAPFEYTSILWGVSFGYLLFGEIPTWSVVFGGLVVMAAGIFIILRERRLGLERQRQRSAMTPPPS